MRKKLRKSEFANESAIDSDGKHGPKQGSWQWKPWKELQVQVQVQTKRESWNRETYRSTKKDVKTQSIMS